MKSKVSFQSQPAYVFGKHKKMLDMAGSKKVQPSGGNPFRDIRQRTLAPILTPSKRGLDGIQMAEKTLLKELKTHSLQDILRRFVRKAELHFHVTKRVVSRLMPAIGPHKMLYGSLIGGVAFGIVSMGFIEHYFGPGVFARSSVEQPATLVSERPSENTPTVLGASTDATQSEYDSKNDIFFEYFNEAADEKYKENIQEMVKGYPIEEMLPYIFEKDHLTAAFLIGIAKKESNWGKRVPVLDNQDCFNYWGYRGIRRLMGTGGHTCFNSRKDAVDTVAKRLETLIQSQQLNTPEKMIIWKCGFTCAGQDRESVKKWISDVDMYFSQAGGDE